MIAAPVLSAEIVPSLDVVWRVFSRNGTVNVLDMVFPYLSGYPRLSLSRLTRKCWRSAKDVSSYNYLCKQTKKVALNCVFVRLFDVVRARDDSEV